MGFFDDYTENEERPRRKTRRGLGDSDRLDWQGMAEEIDEPEDEPNEELEEDEDTIQELEIDEHGRMRRSSRDEIDPDFWNQDDE
jgi:hypothetical protein